jgi:hypothetical protein
MNFAKSVPWYRRFTIGDHWPNKTSWTVFEAQLCGAWLRIERHTSGCTCSYCRGEHGHGLLWLPADRARGWRVLNFFHRLYIRWVPHTKHAEPRYSLDANYQVPHQSRQ